MSKKVNAISNMVFYSQQNPEALGELLAGIIPDVVTSIDVKGAGEITIPSSGDVTETYVSKALSQYGDAMSNAVTLALDGSPTGVSIQDGTVTVSSTATDESFVLKATCGAVEKLVTVKLVAEE